METILQNANFIKVLAWHIEFKFDKETGIRNETLHKHETIVNMSFITRLTEIFIEAKQRHYERFENSMGYENMVFDHERSKHGWGYRKGCKEIVTETVKVYRISTIDNKLDLHLISII